MALIAITLGALVVWFLYSCSKTLCQFRKERRLGGQGYALASMEEGDGGRREPSHTTRSNTLRISRKPSLSSPRSFFHYPSGNSPSRLIQQSVSRAFGAWSNRSAPTHRSLSASRPDSPRLSRPTRLGSPKLTANEGAGDLDQHMLIPPMSITTLYRHPLAARATNRPPRHEPCSKRRGNVDCLFPIDRPKYRFSHSKSYQSLSSPSDDHHLDDLNYLPTSSPQNHDRSSSSTIHDYQSLRPPHHQKQQQRNINSHSCSNLSDFNHHSQ
ncbi:hypothetical protein KEM48_005345 [Puccinia striiformis f. sp. tritici PST-130]|nr:hypothetical protein KEM48_005345 [Puccinia striiformis f. sp. tritici PST-130]